jgi:hypothetical protein
MTNSRKKERFAKPSHEALSDNFMANYCLNPDLRDLGIYPIFRNRLIATPIYNVRARTYTHITSVAPPPPAYVTHYISKAYKSNHLQSIYQAYPYAYSWAYATFYCLNQGFKAVYLTTNRSKRSNNRRLYAILQ